MIKFLARNSLVVGDACGEQGDTKAERHEECGEGTVQLVAEASTAPVDDLLHEALRIEGDLAPQADVEILERNVQHVLAVECAQGVGGRLNRPVVADAVEIGTNIHQRTRYVIVAHTGLRVRAQPQ